MSAHAGEERLGPYCLREQLGEGGMGVVYLASDPADRLVAIKVLRQGVAAEATARRRLAHEVETMRRVSSPYVAEVMDADVTGNPPYIVTRFVPGKTLEDVVAADGPVTGAGLAGLASGLTAALTAVHAAGIVHRDLKPGNVMLLDGQPVVIDFGIAQAADSTRLTMTGMFMGTPGYLAPEVIEGRPSGPAADIHSWGATMAFAATGRPPFGTGTFEAIFYRIVHGQPDLSGMPMALVPLVLAALARDPSRRPAAADLSESVRRLDPAALIAPPAGQPIPQLDGPLPVRTASDLAWSQAPARSAERADGAVAGPAAGPAAAVSAAAGSAVAGPAVAGAAALAAVPLAPGAGQQFAAPLASPPAAWPGTRPLAVRGRDDFADLLPPVNYAGMAGSQAAGPLAPAPYQPSPFPPGPVAGQGPPTGAWPGAAALPRGSSGSPAGGQPSRMPMVLATMAGLVAASVLLPVAGTAAVLAVLVLLRSADVTALRRGRRGTGAAASAAYFPWAVVRSLLRFVLLAPPALLCAGGAAAVAVLAAGSSELPKAAGWAAGALVACYCLGPGSAGCRRPLSRFYGRMTRSAFGAVAGFAGLAAVAVVAVTAAAALAPGYWPATHLGQQLQTAPLSHPFLNQWPSSLARAGTHLLHWLGRRL